MAAWKLGPALACGNTVVLKPAEQTPLSALRLGELLARGGLPATACVNIVTGFGETAGAALAAHPRRRQGRLHRLDRGRQADRQRAAAGNLKRVSLELGGKSPNIVFADADLEAAVEGAAIGDLLQPRPVLLRRLAPVRRAEGATTSSWPKLADARGQDQARPGPGARTPRWARSSPRSSSTA